MCVDYNRIARRDVGADEHIVKDGEHGVRRLIGGAPWKGTLKVLLRGTEGGRCGRLQPPVHTAPTSSNQPKLVASYSYVGNGWSSLGNPLLAGAYFTGGILHAEAGPALSRACESLLGSARVQ